VGQAGRSVRLDCEALIANVPLRRQGDSCKLTLPRGRVGNARGNVLDNKSFFAPLFLQKKRSRSRASSPCRRPQTAKHPAHCFLRAEKGVIKATGFRGGTNKTVPPCGSRRVRQISKMFRWNIFDGAVPFFSALCLRRQSGSLRCPEIGRLRSLFR
jgi:hypothetical protein